MGDVYIPILRDTKDPHYRYKMPKLCAKVEGSGNGIKTVITNMSSVSKALGRPASYPTKYFGCELGAQVTMNNEFIVNGSHDADKLLNLLYGFIRKFVLCTKCNNPETSLNVVNQNIRQKCIACGHEYVIPKTIHKLTTYIINHPPDGTLGSGTAMAPVKGGAAKAATTTVASKSDKKGKKGSGGGTNGTGGNSPTNGHANADSGNDLNNGDYNNKNDDFDDFDDEELTAEAYSKRMNELCDDVHTNMYMSSKEIADVFYKFVKEKKEANSLADPNVQKELVKEAERLEIKDKSVLILSELLFTENFIEEIKTHRLLFLRFCHKNPKAQKYLLGGFEKLVGDVYKEKLFDQICKILKAFYDEDILDEEVIIEWSAKESKKYVGKEMSKKIHEKSAPFIKWLKEAEVEEDDDDDDDDSEEEKKPAQVKNANAGSKSQQQKQQNSKQVNNNHHLNDDDEDEDDGIDLEFSHRVSGIQLIETVKPNVTANAHNATTAGKAEVAGGAASSGQADDDLDIDNI